VPRLALLIYAVLLLGETLWSSLVPLVPTYAARLDLSSTESGVLVAAASVTILLVSLPAGVLADRFGARRLTVASAGLVAAAGVAQGLAPGFAGLIVARAAFGVGFGGLWSAGIALLTESVPAERRARALARVMLVAGLGTTLGPSFAGIAADRLGLAAPFVITAALTAAVTVALALSPAPPTAAPAAAPLRDALGRGGREPLLLGGIAFMTAGGLLANAINLLVPLELRDHGASAAEIGLAFSAASCVFMVATTTVGRLGDRAARLGVGAVAAVAFAALLLLPIGTDAVVPIVGFLVLRAPLTAVLFTISLPISVRGAERAGVGRGAVLGLLNAAWAATAVVAPPLAGAVRDGLGTRAPWFGLLAVALATAAFGRLTAARLQQPASV
jgi:MFS transporter, ACS family, D-galactonate transporter